MKLVTASTMQKLDLAASATFGATVLMQRAGRSIAELVRLLIPVGTIVAFAGPGNNGGDAFAACTELHPEYSCIIYAADPTRPSESREDAVLRAQTAGVHIAPLPKTFEEAQHALAGATCILDGILGVGAKFPLTPQQNQRRGSFNPIAPLARSRDTARPDFAHLIQAINAARAPVMALDVPTGIDSTDGALAPDHTVKADYTLMLGLPKLGVFLGQAREFCGALWFSDLGLGDWEHLTTQAAKSKPHFLEPPPSIKVNDGGDIPTIHLLTAKDAHTLLPQRPFSADKRSSGAPLIIAGSEDFPGAAVLCARGAARMGAGYVTVGTPASTVNILRSHLIEQVAFGFDETDVNAAVALILKHSENAGSIAIGPGLPLSTTMGDIIRRIIKETTLPLVIDASALRHITGHLELLRKHPCVITPHAGEFAHLTDAKPLEEKDRVEGLQQFVKKFGITTLFKGNVTLIADQTSFHLNPTGTNALATAGTGDVLTGMIATLMAQGLPPINAARVAAYLHGLAGQAAQQHYIRGVMAGDIPNHIHDVFLQLNQEVASLAPVGTRLIRLDALSTVKNLNCACASQG